MVAAVAADACAPRQADRCACDAAAMAEMRMWRYDREKRYPVLVLDLSRVNGFAPIDSVRIALAAARTVQPRRG
jgi:hypothetical protein